VIIGPDIFKIQDCGFSKNQRNLPDQGSTFPSIFQA
jgi:hypothetical protein